jgi:hypothetical protein
MIGLSVGMGNQEVVRKLVARFLGCMYSASDMRLAMAVTG